MKPVLIAIVLVCVCTMNLSAQNESSTPGEDKIVERIWKLGKLSGSDVARANAIVGDGDQHHSIYGLAPDSSLPNFKLRNNTKYFNPIFTQNGFVANKSTQLRTADAREIAGGLADDNGMIVERHSAYWAYRDDLPELMEGPTYTVADGITYRTKFSIEIQKRIPDTNLNTSTVVYQVVGAKPPGASNGVLFSIEYARRNKFFGGGETWQIKKGHNNGVPVSYVPILQGFGRKPNGEPIYAKFALEQRIGSQPGESYTKLWLNGEQVVLEDSPIELNPTGNRITPFGYGVYGSPEVKAVFSDIEIDWIRDNGSDDLHPRGTWRQE